MCYLIHRKLALEMRVVPSSTPTQVGLFYRFKDASGSVRRGKKPQNSPGVKHLVFGNRKGGYCRERTPCKANLNHVYPPYRVPWKACGHGYLLVFGGQRGQLVTSDAPLLLLLALLSFTPALCSLLGKLRYSKLRAQLSWIILLTN